MKIIRDKEDYNVILEIVFAEGENQEACTRMIENIEKERYDYLKNNFNKQTEMNIHLADNQLETTKLVSSQYSFGGRMPMLPMNQGYDQTKKGLPDFGEIDLTGGEEQQEKK